MKTPLEQLFDEIIEAWEANENLVINDRSIDFDGDNAELERRKAEWLERFKAATAGRYAAFACDHYYPAGHFNDCVGRFGTKAEANEKLRDVRADEKCVHDLLKLVGQQWSDE